MSTNQKDNQNWQDSRNDDSKNQAYRKEEASKTSKAGQQAADNDDDFLSGDNQKKDYPNNQNNPNRDYNEQSLSPGKNPNIGGNESEYETSTPDDELYDEDTTADNNDGFVERRDSEEINRHDDETRYSHSYDDPDQGYHL